MPVKMDKIRVLTILIVVIFILSLIPIFMVSFYAHPVFDDYSYSAEVYHALEEGESLGGVLKAACGEALTTYHTWQGSFVAIFFFALQPGVFSQDLYFLTTFVMIGMLTVSTFCLMYAVFVKWLELRKEYVYIVTALVVMLQIQFVPNKAEAFFWFNGSSYYSLFYSLSQFMFALLISAKVSCGRKSKIGMITVAAILSALIGGGNYTTVLVTGIIMATVLTVAIYNKSKDAYIVIPAFISLLFTFSISILSPGNDVRAMATTKMSAPEAIIHSLYNAVVYFGGWTRMVQIVVYVFILPVIYLASSKCKWTFRYPVLVILWSFGCYAAQFTPPLYAMSHIGAGRQVDIYYYATHLLAIFQMFYICGWVNKKYQGMLDRKTVKVFLLDNLWVLSAGCAALFIAGCYAYGVKAMTTVETTLAYKAGLVQQYDKEYEEILECIQAGENICYVSDIETCPGFFYTLDLAGKEDSQNYWHNGSLAKYFGLEKVLLEERND